MHELDCTEVHVPVFVYTPCSMQHLLFTLLSQCELSSFILYMSIHVRRSKETDYKTRTTWFTQPVTWPPRGAHYRDVRSTPIWAALPKPVLLLHHHQHSTSAAWLPQQAPCLDNNRWRQACPQWECSCLYRCFYWPHVCNHGANRDKEDGELCSCPCHWSMLYTCTCTYKVPSWFTVHVYLHQMGHSHGDCPSLSTTCTCCSPLYIVQKLPLTTLLLIHCIWLFTNWSLHFMQHVGSFDVPKYWVPLLSTEPVSFKMEETSRRWKQRHQLTFTACLLHYPPPGSLPLSTCTWPQPLSWGMCACLANLSESFYMTYVYDSSMP